MRFLCNTQTYFRLEPTAVLCYTQQIPKVNAEKPFTETLNVLQMYQQAKQATEKKAEKQSGANCVSQKLAVILIEQ